MATQTVTLPFAGTPTTIAGAGVDWTNPGNAQAADGSYAEVQWSGGGVAQSSDSLEALNLDTVNLPLLALPTLAQIALIGVKDRLVANAEYIKNGTLRYNGAQRGTTDATKNGDGVDLTTSPTTHYFNGTTFATTLTRAIVDHATFGCRVVGQSKTSTTASDRLDLDQLALKISYDDRTPSGIAGENRAGCLAFTADRGFVGDTIFDWRTEMKEGAGLTESSMRFRIEWQVDGDGSFADPLVCYTPSVSDARSWEHYPEGDDPMPVGYERDPKEILFLTGVGDGETYYARCRVVMLDTDGTVLEAGGWSASASATKDASVDPVWAGQSIADVEVAEGDLSRCWLLFFHLGGGSYEGANSEDQLGISLTGCIDDSYWKGVRATFDTALAAAGKWRSRLGFFCRSGLGTHKAQDSPTTSREWFELQGGRNNDLSAYSATGGGTSPAMATALQVYEHARNLAPGTTRTRMLSVADDLEELAGIGVPVIMYQSLPGSAHTHVVGGNDQATAEQILNAHGLLRPLKAGLHLALDVFYNAAPDDPELGTPSMEKLVARSLQTYGRRWFGERMGKAENAAWLPEIGSLAGDDVAFSLLLDDDQYLADKVLNTRVDLLEYLQDGETNPGDMPPSVLTILMVTTGFCQFVAAGATNAEKCARALDVVKDIYYTWRGRVLPAFLSQAIWDELVYADLDDCMEYVQELLGEGRCTPQSPRGYASGLLLREETVWGTFNTDPAQESVRTPFISESLRVNQREGGLIHTIEAGSSPAGIGTVGRHSIVGEIETELSTNGWGPLLLKHGIGAAYDTTITPTGYIHNGQTGSLPTGLTVDKALVYPDGTVFNQRFAGCRVSSLVVEVQRGRAAQLRAQLVGRSMTRTPAPTTWRFADGDLPLFGHEFVVRLDRDADGFPELTGNFTRAQFTVDNGLNTGAFAVESGAYIGRLPQGRRSVTGLIEGFWTSDDEQILDLWTANTPIALSLVGVMSSDQSQYIQFDFPACYIRDTPVPQVAGRGLVRFNFSFLCGWDAGLGYDLAWEIKSVEDEISSGAVARLP